MDPTKLFDPDAAMVAMIDIQENHFHTVVEADGVLDRTARFLRAANILEVPVLLTEHYPRAFGPTLPQVAEALPGIEPIAKTSFGCFGEPRFAAAVSEVGRGVLYVVGSETHICVQQTALTARERGLDVVLLVDCVSARSRRDHKVAVRRMEAAGVLLATWESVVYEWLGGASHPSFKSILPLVKG